MYVPAMGWKWRAEVHLPGIVIGIDDIRLSGRKKQWKQSAGPFLILPRGCPFALGVGAGSDSGTRPELQQFEGRSSQLWFLDPSGIQGEVFIVSAANKLVMDSGTDPANPHLVLWERHGEPWQRWRLELDPDGSAYFLRAAHSGRYLIAPENYEEGWTPWFETRDPAKRHQRWVLATPYGGTVKDD
jgi:hypothetical protein